jgi:hypothetical protein
MISLDNFVSKEGDITPFEDISDLGPPIPERMALLKIAACGEVVTGIGFKVDDDTYIVQEM